MTWQPSRFALSAAVSFPGAAAGGPDGAISGGGAASRNSCATTGQHNLPPTKISEDEIKSSCRMHTLRTLREERRRRSADECYKNRGILGPALVRPQERFHVRKDRRCIARAAHQRQISTTSIRHAQSILRTLYEPRDLLARCVP